MQPRLIITLLTAVQSIFLLSATALADPLPDYPQFDYTPGDPPAGSVHPLSIFEDLNLEFEKSTKQEVARQLCNRLTCEIEPSREDDISSIYIPIHEVPIYAPPQSIYRSRNKMVYSDRFTKGEVSSVYNYLKLSFRYKDKKTDELELIEIVLTDKQRNHAYEYEWFFAAMVSALVNHYHDPDLIELAFDKEEFVDNDLLFLIHQNDPAHERAVRIGLKKSGVYDTGIFGTISIWKPTLRVRQIISGARHSRKSWSSNRETISLLVGYYRQIFTAFGQAEPEHAPWLEQYLFEKIL